MENNNQQLAPAEGVVQKPALDRDMATFVGKNVDYYVLKWAARDAAGNVRITWNIGAFFGGPIWLIYRKMYSQTVVYVLGAAVLSLVVNSLSKPLASVTNLIFPVALGCAANSLYYSKVKREVAVLRTQYFKSDELDSHLVQRGGTNSIGAWITAIIVNATAVTSLWPLFRAIQEL
jgi:hypothetical protein